MYTGSAGKSIQQHGPSYLDLLQNIANGDCILTSIVSHASLPESFCVYSASTFACHHHAALQWVFTNPFLPFKQGYANSLRFPILKAHDAASSIQLLPHAQQGTASSMASIAANSFGAVRRSSSESPSMVLCMICMSHIQLFLLKTHKHSVRNAARAQITPTHVHHRMHSMCTKVCTAHTPYTGHNASKHAQNAP